MSEIPYLGSRISLISKSENRYEGTLFTIDTKELAVALQNVQCFGTEGRLGAKGGTDVPPTNEIYEFIIFRASDIKDLHVCGPARKGPTDPAIISQSAPTTPSQQPPTVAPPQLGPSAGIPSNPNFSVPQPQSQPQVQQPQPQPQPQVPQQSALLPQPSLLPQPQQAPLQAPLQPQPQPQPQQRTPQQASSQAQKSQTPAPAQTHQPTQTTPPVVETKQSGSAELTPPSHFEKPQQQQGQQHHQHHQQRNRDNQYQQHRYNNNSNGNHQQQSHGQPHSQGSQQPQGQSQKYPTHQKPQYARVAASGLPNQTNVSPPQANQAPPRTYQDYNNRKPGYTQGGYTNRTYQNGNNAGRGTNQRGRGGPNQRYHNPRGRGGNAGARTSPAPLEAFDFESSNAKFEKLKLADDLKEDSENDQKHENLDSENSESSNDHQEQERQDQSPNSSSDESKHATIRPNAEAPKKSTVYNPKTSFYDSISCEASERQESEGKKARSFSEQRKIDAETFGFTTVYHNQHHNQNNRGSSGPSRGRGGYSRGYNSRPSNPRSGVLENL